MAGIGQTTPGITSGGTPIVAADGGGPVVTDTTTFTFTGDVTVTAGGPGEAVVNVGAGGAMDTDFGNSVPAVKAQDFGGFQLNNVADPTAPQDVATKSYADALPGTGANKQLSNLLVTSINAALIADPALPIFDIETPNDNGGNIIRISTGSESLGSPSGDLQFFTGGSNGINSGPIVFFTGNVSAALADSGFFQFITGVSTAGGSGNFDAFTGNAGTASGRILLGTGTSAAGNSGGFDFNTGNATGGDSGSYTFAVGTATGNVGKALFQCVINLQNLTGDPPNPAGGDMYFNSNTAKFRGYDGTTWVDLN